MSRVPKQLWMIVLLLTALVVIFAPDARAGGHRLVVQLDEPFVVNGQMHPAGKLAVKELRHYSPVATVHEIRVDGRALGYFLAERTPGSEVSTDDELIFTRGTDGRLVLHAIALKGESSRAIRPTAPALLEDRPGARSDTGVLQAAKVAR